MDVMTLAASKKYTDETAFGENPGNYAKKAEIEEYLYKIEVDSANQTLKITPKTTEE